MTDAAVEICHINIGPKQQARRRVIGIAGLALAVFLGGALVALRVPVAWRLLCLPLLFLGASGLLQARAKT